MDLEEKKLYAFSPYLFKNNMVCVNDSKKTGCDFKELNSLLKKGHLNSIDCEIVSLLKRYEYLTKLSITGALNSSLSDDLKKSDYRVNIKKLCNYGLVNRFHLSYTENDVEKRTPSFYRLTASGRAFVSRLEEGIAVSILKRVYSSAVADGKPLAILKLLVSNQFAISVGNTYDVVGYSNFDIKVGKSIFCLKYWFRAGNTDVVLLVARRNSNWKKEIVSQISFINEYCQKDSSLIKAPIYLVISEDEFQCSEFERYRKTCDKVSSLSVLYSTDVSLVNGDILDNLLRVVPSNDYRDCQVVSLMVKKKE